MDEQDREVGLPYVDVRDVIEDVRRFRLALRIIAGLPDDAGHTHAAALGTSRSLYARGVLAGWDPADVEGAIKVGGER